MQVIFLSDAKTILLDIVSWIFFHLSIGYWSSTINIERFDPNFRLFKTMKWEDGGEIYNRIFKVKKWKKYIPSGAKLYKGAYQVKHIQEITVDNLKIWIRESCRSEYCHIIMFLPCFLFFLWNSADVGWWMVTYAFLNNLVPIVMQRYNRPRAQRYLKILETKLKKAEIEQAQPLLKSGNEEIADRNLFDENGLEK